MYTVPLLHRLWLQICSTHYKGATPEKSEGGGTVYQSRKQKARAGGGFAPEICNHQWEGGWQEQLVKQINKRKPSPEPISRKQLNVSAKEAPSESDKHSIKSESQGRFQPSWNPKYLQRISPPNKRSTATITHYDVPVEVQPTTNEPELVILVEYSLQRATPNYSHFH
jgi:hypothetical protein